MVASESLLHEIEHYCNNYFNPRNDPNSTERNYPAAFLELAARIAEFAEKTKKHNITSESVLGYSMAVDLNHSAWQKAFASELAIYKRAKFI